MLQNTEVCLKESRKCFSLYPFSLLGIKDEGNCPKICINLKKDIMEVIMQIHTAVL